MSDPLPPTHPSAMASVRPTPSESTEATRPEADDPFVVRGVLGRGGTATVWRAIQASLGREVAIKELRPELLRLRNVLVREARVVAALEHPGVIPVHDLVFGPDGAPRLVMARVEGTSWLRYLDDPGTLPADAAADPERFHLETLIRVCRVLEFAHDRGVLHRDVKPENVMLGRFGETYVLDWGIAVTTRDDAAWMPHARDARQAAGTPAYMAPEMLGGGPIGPPTDVFLLGATLYHVLAGRPPYGSPMPATLDEVRRAAPSPPPGPADLVACVGAAMARDTGSRPTLTAFRSAIELHLATRAAARLVRDALPRLEALEAAVRDGGDPTVVHHTYGEVSFGFRQAMQEAPITEAVDGVRRASIAMARWALREGDLGAATRHLVGLPDPPEDLVRERERLAARRATEARTAAAARRDHDPRVGNHPRAVLLIVFAGVWVVGPLAAWPFVAPTDLGYGYNFGSSAAFLSLSAGASAAVRHSAWDTAFNRSIVDTLVVQFVTQLALDVGGWLAGAAPHDVHTLRLLLWSAVCGGAGISIRRSLAVPALGFLAAFLVASAFPPTLLPAISSANLVFALVALTLLDWTGARRP